VVPAPARRACQGAIADFCSFVGIHQPAPFQAVTRGHVLAWRTQLERRRLDQRSGVNGRRNALENDAEISKLQAGLGHANISTTKSTIDENPEPKHHRRSRCGIDLSLLDAGS
jgi:hypothetical protein